MDPTRLIAYRTQGLNMKIVPAVADRPWMAAAQTTFANRCLPMRLANQHGWFLLNPSPIEVFWNGGKLQKDLSIKKLDDRPTPALSHFGHGVLTWWLPYLFRTPEGVNLHVRGPANYCKDGIVPLEAIVEADWAVASFPMSWKMTRIGSPVRFEVDEPICMFSPVTRGCVERFEPEIDLIQSAPELKQHFDAWSASRKAHNESLTKPDAPRTWQKHYFVGTHPSTTQPFPDHQVRLRVKSFKHIGRTAEGNTHAEPIENVPVSNLRKCPFHAISEREASSTLPTERDFFPRAEDISDFLRRDHEGRNDVTSKCWTFDAQSRKTGILSADIGDILPTDLSKLVKERLSIWGNNARLGTLESLQISLMLASSQRNNTLVEAGSTYVLVPLFMESHERGEHLLMDAEIPPARASFRDLFRTRKKLIPNQLIAVSSEHRFSIRFNKKARAQNRYAFLLEGSFSGVVQHQSRQAEIGELQLA